MLRKPIKYNILTFFHPIDNTYFIGYNHKCRGVIYMEEKIKTVLEEKVNPLLESHYGGATLVSYETISQK